MSAFFSDLLCSHTRQVIRSLCADNAIFRVLFARLSVLCSSYDYTRFSDCVPMFEHSKKNAEKRAAESLKMLANNGVVVIDNPEKKGGEPWTGSRSEILKQVSFSLGGKKIGYMFERFAGTREQHNCGGVMDVASGETQFFNLKHLGGVAISPDGRTLALSSLMEQHVIDVESGSQIKVFHGKPRHFTAFTPDGKKLATPDGGATLRIIDIRSGTSEVFDHVKTYLLSSSMVFSPDGRMLAMTADDGTGRVTLLDVRSGRSKTLLCGAPGHATHVAFSPSGSRIAICGLELPGFGIELRDLITGASKRIDVSQAPFSVIHSMVFSPDEKSLLTLLNCGLACAIDVGTGEVCLVRQLFVPDILEEDAVVELTPQAKVFLDELDQ